MTCPSPYYQLNNGRQDDGKLTTRELGLGAATVEDMKISTSLISLSTTCLLWYPRCKSSQITVALSVEVSSFAPRWSESDRCKSVRLRALWLNLKNERQQMTRTRRWRGWSFIGAAALASTLALSPLQAQGNPIAFGVVAGASFPISDFGDAANTGWHAGGLLQWRGPFFPLGIRGEVVYHQFESKFDDEAKLTLLTALVNGVWTFPVTEPATIRPYIIGGGGLYRVGCSDCGGLDSENKGGINLGGGIEFPLSGFTSIIEARWHMIFDKEDDIDDDSNSMFVPISVGLMFR